MVGHWHHAQCGDVILQVRSKLLDVAQGSTTQGVGDRQHPRKRVGSQALHVHRFAIGASRVCLDELMHLRFVGRVQRSQLLGALNLQGCFGCAKAHAACMQHEGVQRVHVAPACLDRPLAKIVFLPVAFAKALCIEQAHLLQTIPAYVHAKTNTGGDVDAGARVRLGKQIVQRRRVVAWRKAVFLAEPGVAANGGVVREGGDGAHVCTAVRRCTQTVEPLVGDFGI